MVSPLHPDVGTRDGDIAVLSRCPDNSTQREKFGRRHVKCVCWTQPLPHDTEPMLLHYGQRLEHTVYFPQKWTSRNKLVFLHLRMQCCVK